MAVMVMFDGLFDHDYVLVVMTFLDLWKALRKMERLFGLTK